jgi:anti-sigma regulatory factor (Ser/Thr protein kinase)
VASPDQGSKVPADEVCSNIIEHAYGGLDPTLVIRVRCAAEPGQRVIEIQDSGKPFDPTGTQTPTFSDHWRQGELRGAGWFLIQQWIDRVSYDQDENQNNRLKPVKKRGTTRLAG